MLLRLECQRLDALTPALRPGDCITLDVRDSSATVIVPGTPTVLQRIAQAIREGALILTDASDPLLAEMERLIMADRDRLLAEADAILAAPHLDRAG